MFGTASQGAAIRAARSVSNQYQSVGGVGISTGELIANAQGMPGDVYRAGADAQQYFKEQQAALASQAAILPRAVQIEEQIRPELQAAYSRGITSQSGMLLGVYDQLNPVSQAYQARSIGQDVSMFGMAGQLGTQAYLGSMNPRTRGIFNTMQQQALSDLRLGAQLSPEDMTFAEQSGRAYSTSMGLSGSRAAAIEAMSGYNVRRQREAERRNFALQAYGVGEAAAQTGYQFYGSPAMQNSQIYGVPGLMATAEAGLGALGPQFLTPESQYLANIRANRIQQENADRAAAAQVKAGKAAGVGNIVSGVGTAVAAYFI